MNGLKFDKTKCRDCKGVFCLTRCQYIHLDSNAARKEWQKIVDGEESFVLEACTTCYACEEYCPFHNHPFYLIVERQEEKGILPAPRPVITMWINQCQPVGRFTVGRVGERMLSYCFLPHFNTLVRGRLFEDTAGAVVFGQEFFCNAVYLHYARTSVIKERLPQITANLGKLGIKELICLHDECYGTFISLAPAYGIEVPFKPVHYFEYLLGKLRGLGQAVKKLGIKAAYQRNCSSRLAPETDRLVDEIFSLIGVDRARREYDRENALCCAEIMRMGKGPALADDIQRRNIDDMVKAGAEYCVFNCPACWDALAEKVAGRDIKPIHIIDLCKLAIGEPQSLKLPQLAVEV